MTISESSEGLSVMAMLVVAAAPVPPVMVSASPVHVSVAVAAPMLDLDHGVVLRGDRGHAQPGGSGYGLASSARPIRAIRLIQCSPFA
jgi:hypothetical protein